MLWRSQEEKHQGNLFLKEKKVEDVELSNKLIIFVYFWYFLSLFIFKTSIVDASFKCVYTGIIIEQ
ncbi:MAG: hypothetical protein COW87_01810 [Candidatus Levybacteria bacterium CG22_combo_CG10-13_8_21_14_all_35_11]|nr:MAG: hypothetical protein COW87_01810 [Candidatus Levybacteria bacterium CG22_combo_CG10-13_8_21_14_all_35_11]